MGKRGALKSCPGEAVERELSRLFVQEDVPPAGPWRNHLAPARRNPQVLSGSVADALGAQVARTLYEGMLG